MIRIKTTLEFIMIFRKKLTEKEKISQFWDWFQKNNKSYLFLNQVDSISVKDDLLDKFLEKLHQYNDKLFFEIGGHPDDENVELIISAEGNVEYFEKVEHLVNSAPKIKHWQVIAFKPPMGKGFKTNYHDKDFDPSKIIFIPLNNEDNPNLIGLQVCYPDFNEEESETFVNGTYLVIDTLIGERSCALDINYLEVTITPSNIKDYNFMHLEDLQEFINNKKQQNNE